MKSEKTIYPLRSRKSNPLSLTVETVCPFSLHTGYTDDNKKELYATHEVGKAHRILSQTFAVCPIPLHTGYTEEKKKKQPAIARAESE